MVLILVATIVATLTPGMSRTVRGQAVAGPGGGARFLPADTVFYLALDTTPGSPQLQYLDRLAAVYLRAPEVEAAEKRAGRALNVEALLDEVVRGRHGWVGGEVFLGTTSIVASPEHPLLGRLLHYLLPNAPPPSRPPSPSSRSGAIPEPPLPAIEALTRPETFALTGPGGWVASGRGLVAGVDAAARATRDGYLDKLSAALPEAADSLRAWQP